MTRYGRRSKIKSIQKESVCFESPVLLYSVLVGVFINLFALFYNNDDQSVFLFIIISAIVYTITHNMIIVLTSSIIIVNSLILLKSFFKNHKNQIEGFENNDEYIEIHEKIISFTEDNPPPDDEIDGKDSVSDIIDSVLDNPLFNDDDELVEDYDIKPVENLMEFISEILNDYDDDTSNESVMYVMELNEYLNSSDEKE